MTVCKNFAVPPFSNKLRIYTAPGTRLSGLCIAFCCCLYYMHTAPCSCAAYRKGLSDWSVCHKTTWFVGTYFCKPKKIIIIIIIIVIITIIPFHAKAYSTHSCSLSTINFPLSLPRLPAGCNWRRPSVCLPHAAGCVLSSYHYYLQIYPKLKMFLTTDRGISFQ